MKIKKEDIYLFIVNGEIKIQRGDVYGNCKATTTREMENGQLLQKAKENVFRE